MNRNKSMLVQNKIKFFPPPNIQDNLSINNTVNKAFQPARHKNFQSLNEFPSFTRLNSTAFGEYKTYSNILFKNSVLDKTETLLYPRFRGKSYMLNELNKIILQCEDGFLNNKGIKDSIKKTEQVIEQFTEKVKKIHAGFRSKKAFRMVNRGKEPVLNRASIKIMIQDMKRGYIRTMAM